MLKTLEMVSVSLSKYCSNVTVIELLLIPFGEFMIKIIRYYDQEVSSDVPVVSKKEFLQMTSS